MLILYAKYTLLLGLFVGHNENERLQEDKALFNAAACSKHCLENNIAKSFRDCFDYCQNANDTTNLALHKVQDNFLLMLVCRTESALSFRINWVQHDREQVKNSSQKDAMFMIKIHEKSNPDTKRLHYLSDDSFFTIPDLEDNTEYSITALSMQLDGGYSNIANDESFSTLRRGYQPSAMGEVQFRRYYQDPTNWRRIAADVEWQSSVDRNCLFDIIHYSTNSHSLGAPMPVHFRDPSQPYVYTVSNMKFGEQFQVGVRTVNDKNHLESEVRWLVLNAPNCLDWYNYNYTICEPLKPNNLTVLQSHFERDVLALNVSWEFPKYLPDNYTLYVLDLHKDGNRSQFYVERTASHYYIPNITILGSSFEVHLMAHTKGGNNATMRMLTKLPLEPWIKVSTMVKLMIFSPILSICCIFGLFSIKNCRHNRHLEDEELKTAPNQSTDFHLTLATLAVEDNFELDDDLEVEPHAVLLQDVLGEGAFGLVRRGIYKQRQVAVKLLKDQPNEEDVEAFRCEIQMLKSVGRHPNIVGIVGYSTRCSKRMMLLIEYCGLGSLQSFLRDEWKFRQELCLQSKHTKSDKKSVERLLEYDTRIEDINSSVLSTLEEETESDLSTIDSYRLGKGCVFAADNKSYGLQDIENIDANPPAAPPTNLKRPTKQQPRPFKKCIVSFENQEYFQPTAMDAQLTTKREPLKYADLLDIAQQVAVGMDFLAQNKIVHRDLAARNVLISLDRTIKIADFGLSRDVYHENVYRKSGGSGKLPIKWLALESLTHQVYTSQSDVWSFGVLLYEIITLGGMPYPSISPRDLLQLLRQGVRMKRPDGCSDDLFALMESCWCSIPANRPTFSDLMQRLGVMLLATKEVPQRLLQQLNSPEHCQLEKQAPNDPHYLQPLH
ncbi:tyrosine-protein kinase receptor torso [Drosophila nasuta]|uniref:tyrosine-protein kinase receptor torso n=1 Tax=Drosophila nasuta TaxID=42062 RepID=UPI00295E3644|nr:tyrosine-protein kinase receptor torso [Drosophila nasuta]